MRRYWQFRRSLLPASAGRHRATPDRCEFTPYRLALAATGEYSAAVSPTPITTAKVLAAMVTSVNRVNAVYEREFAIRLVLVNNISKSPSSLARMART